MNHYSLKKLLAVLLAVILVLGVFPDRKSVV